MVKEIIVRSLLFKGKEERQQMRNGIYLIKAIGTCRHQDRHGVASTLLELDHSLSAGPTGESRMDLAITIKSHNSHAFYLFLKVAHAS